MRADAIARTAVILKFEKIYISLEEKKRKGHILGLGSY
jgi:hypothetical protein